MAEEFRDVVAKVQQIGLEVFSRLSELGTLAKEGALDQTARANANVEINALNGIMVFHDTILRSFSNNEIIKQLDALRRAHIAIYDDIMYPERQASAAVEEDAENEDEHDEEEYEEDDEEENEDEDEGEEIHEDVQDELERTGVCQHPDCPTFGEAAKDCTKPDCPQKDKCCHNPACPTGGFPVGNTCAQPDCEMGGAR